MKALIAFFVVFSVTCHALAASLERNLQILSERPANLSKVRGYNLPTKEFDPFAPDAEKTLEAFDRAYEDRYGSPSHLADGWDDLTGCYQISCPVFAYVSRANQTLTLYMNGQPVDTWLVSTGMPGHATPALNTHVTSRIYTAYTSTKYPEGDYNGLGNMPYAVFVSGGIAIHGTPQGNWKRLGRPASHGCIRVHPANAEVFNRLVRENGPRNVWVVVE